MRFIHRSYLFLYIISCLFIIHHTQPVCGQTDPTTNTPPKKSSQLMDWIVAVVNDDIVLASEVKQRALFNFRSLPNAPSLTSEEGKRKLLELRERTIDEFIDELLILQQENNPEILRVLKNHSPLSPAEIVKNHREALKAQNGLTTDEQLDNAIRSQGFTVQEFYERIVQQTRVQKVINIAIMSKIEVTDDEIRLLYEKMNREAKKTALKVHILHILLPVPEQASPTEIERKQNLANTMMQKLNQGDEFQKVAKTYETEGVSPAPVDLGSLDILDLPNVLRQAILPLEKGQLTGPVHSERGFHLLKLIDKDDKEILPFDKINTEELRKQLLEQKLKVKLQNWVKELRRTAFIEIRQNE